MKKKNATEPIIGRLTAVVATPHDPCSSTATTAESISDDVRALIERTYMNCQVVFANEPLVAILTLEICREPAQLSRRGHRSRD